MKLYEYDQAIDELFESGIDPDTGEIIREDFTEALDQLQMGRTEKLINCALYIKSQRAQEDAIKLEIDRLQHKRKVLANARERTENFILHSLAPEEKVKHPDFPHVSIGWRRSEYVHIDDVKALPSDFLRYKDPEPDRNGLKSAIKNGTEIEGVELRTRQNLAIR